MINEREVILPAHGENYLIEVLEGLNCGRLELLQLVGILDRVVAGLGQRVQFPACFQIAVKGGGKRLDARLVYEKGDSKLRGILVGEIRHAGQVGKQRYRRGVK